MGQSHLALAIAASFFLYHASLVIYRLYFHPLAKFPGPKLAAASRWWECYQDLFTGQGGEYILQVEEMHNKYGPVVRVTPDEIHIKDPEWARVLYAGPLHIRHKDSSLAHAAGTAEGSFGTVSHELHAKRRAPVSAYFSKASVERHLYEKISDRSTHMCNILREHYQKGTVVSGRALFLGWSNDSLRSCTFDESLNLLDDPERAMEFDQVFKAFAAAYPILKQCEWMIPFALSLPIAPFRYIYKPLATILTVHHDMIKTARRDTERHQTTMETEKYGAAIDTSARAHTLYLSLLSSSMPQSEKLPTRMAHEGFEILLAGSDTTARTMGIAAYHVMANPSVAKQLLEELKTVMPGPHSPVTLRALEQLPYLNAVMKEALRIGKVTDHRLSLVAPDEDLSYGEWTMPRGVCEDWAKRTSTPQTRISMTPTRNSYDEKYFPSPMAFAPERWLQSPQKLAAMNHVFMPFAHGRRGCLGLHFAQAELRTAIALMFRQFEFELHDVVRERDIDHSWAHIAGEPAKNGKGLRFKVKECLS